MAKRIAPGLYMIASESGLTKIGISTDPQRRLKALQTGHFEKLHLAWETDLSCGVVQARDYERAMHKILAPFRVKGEWYKAPETCINRATKLVFFSLTRPELWRRYCRRYPRYAQACALKQARLSGMLPAPVFTPPPIREIDPPFDPIAKATR